MTLQNNRPFQKDEETLYTVVVAVRDERDVGTLVSMGCSLAAAHDGEVRVVTVSASGSPPSWLKLPEECEAFPVKVVARQGRNVGEVILKEVRQSQTDVLVLGWSGQLSRGRYRFGSTLDPVIQGAPSQVLLVRSEGLHRLERILIPVAGGPNAPQAFEVARAFAPEAEITALYVANPRYGPGEVMLGEERIENILDGLLDKERIHSQVVSADDPVQGILDEAEKGYDLLLLGAGGEGLMDRFLFGDIPQAILANSPVPTAVVRRRPTNLRSLQRRIWMRIFRFGPTLTTQEQAQVYKTIRRGARPSTDFWMMIALASIIAALGLLLNSPAIIIGAMLVAPLMTVILGMGLSIVMGDPKFFWRAFSTTARGAGLAILMGFLTTLLVPGAAATPEVLARVNPTLMDLGVALAAGAAAAYAMCRRDVSAALAGVAIAAALAPPLTAVGIGLAEGTLRIAGGAFLLFLTNIVAIVAAGGGIFLWLGFQPQPGDLSRGVVLRRGFFGIAVLLFLVSIPLGILTVTSSQEARLQREVEAALTAELAARPGMHLVAWSILEETEEETLQIDVTVRVASTLGYQEARSLQEDVAARLGRPVALSLGMVPTTRLRAFVPPTPTPTPEPTPTGLLTETPPPSPTPPVTSTPLPTLTVTSTPPITPPATSTPVPSATPWLLRVRGVGTGGLNVRYAPHGIVVGALPEETMVTVIEGPIDVDGRRWYRVFATGERLEGWVAEEYLTPVEP